MNYLPPRLALALLLCAGLPLRSSESNLLSATPPRPWKVDQYLTKYRYLAARVYREHGVPLAITLAVAGLESDWGLSDLALNSNNHFGIKDHDWAGPTYCQATTEWQPEGGFLPVTACFRKYSLVAQSYEDFGLFLHSRPRYQGIFDYPNWNYNAWSQELHASGYATDPQYAGKIMRLIEEYLLFQFDEW